MLYIEIPKLQCVIKENTGVDCPGCGLQRSVEYLLNGEVMKSLQIYPGLIPLVCVFLFLGLHLWIDKAWTLRLMSFTFWLTSIVILGNYILKFI
nr:DUF2752 domain-containing protein [Elizabethkingia sp. ASV34]